MKLLTIQQPPKHRLCSFLWTLRFILLLGMLSFGSVLVSANTQHELYNRTMILMDNDYDITDTVYNVQVTTPVYNTFYSQFRLFYPPVGYETLCNYREPSSKDDDDLTNAISEWNNDNDDYDNDNLLNDNNLNRMVPTGLLFTSSSSDMGNCSIQQKVFNAHLMNLALPITNFIKYFIIPIDDNDNDTNNSINRTASMDTEDVVLVYITQSELQAIQERMASLQQSQSDKDENATPSPFLFESGYMKWDFSFILGDANGKVYRGFGYDNDNDDNGNNNNRNHTYEDLLDMGDGWFGVLNFIIVGIVSCCLIRSYCYHRRQLHELYLQRAIRRAQQHQQEQERTQHLLTKEQIDTLLPEIPYNKQTMLIEKKTDRVTITTGTNNNNNTVMIDTATACPTSSDEEDSSLARSIEMTPLKHSSSSEEDDDDDEAENDERRQEEKDAVVVVEVDLEAPPTSGNSSRTSSSSNTYNSQQRTTETNCHEKDTDNSTVGSSPTKMSLPATTTTSTCCSICIDDFEEGEMIVILPRCHHAYHKECVEQWLVEKQGCCPMCKVNVLEQPNPITTAVEPAEQQPQSQSQQRRLQPMQIVVDSDDSSSDDDDFSV